MEKKEMICIVCPFGCHLEICKEEICSYAVKGNKCKRGEEYAIKEMTNPTRVLTAAVKLNRAHLKKLPVRTEAPIPKSLISECMKELKSIEISAPVSIGEVIISNILGTGVNVISSRSVEAFN